VQSPEGEPPRSGDLRSVRVRVPASAANLGPGFDCVGLALALHNEVLLTPADEWEVDGDRDPARLASHPAFRGARRAFAWIEQQGGAGRAPRGLHVRQANRIPVGRGGLGNSATAVLAGVAGALALAGRALDRSVLIDLATDVEGHPDNAAASALGGLVVAVRTERGVVARSVRMPRPPRVVLAVPALEVPTTRARERLPATLPFGDAVYTVGRAALLVAALAAGDDQLLRVAMDDRIHTGYRAPLVPGLVSALAAARDAGALGAALSGSGPAALAFVPHGAPDLEAAVASALATAFAAAGLACEILAVDVDDKGLVLT
jgi:homoserine kinase